MTDKKKGDLRPLNQDGTETGRISCKRENRSNPPTRVVQGTGADFPGITKNGGWDFMIQSVANGDAKKPEAIVFWPPIPSTPEEVNEGTFKYVPIAISFNDLTKYGCPGCGTTSSAGAVFKAYNGTTAWKCAKCGEKYFALTEGLEISTLGFGDPNIHGAVIVYPVRSEHPFSTKSSE